MALNRDENDVKNGVVTMQVCKQRQVCKLGQDQSQNLINICQVVTVHKI